MRILVDGDGCPVLEITSQVAAEFSLELLVYTDLNHRHQLSYGKLIIVDQGFQSVDMILYNNLKAGDLVITVDYGLAALALGAKARVLSFSGREFNNRNIDNLLARRHLQRQQRKKTGRHTSHHKRTSADDLRFKQSLLEIIREID
jgi:hypothetical protein